MTEENFAHGSSQLGEILLLGAEEIIGSSEINAILNLVPMKPGLVKVNHSAPLKQRVNIDIAAVQQAFETFYGPRGGQGIAMRAGRASFKYLLRQYGVQLGMVGLNFRMLPVPTRLKTGLETLAALMGQIGDDQVRVEDHEKGWMWKSQSCPICWERVSREQACHFTAGLLQEFSSWASGGQFFGVTETMCRAKGDPVCLIQIEKKPLD